MRISLQHALLLTLLAALALGGFFGNASVAWVGLAACMTVVVGQLVRLFVTTGAPRACAVGFVVAAISYASMILLVGNSEFDYRRGVLPQTRLLQSRINSEIPWPKTTDPNKKKVLIDRRVSKMERRAQSLLPLGHATIAIFFGFAGSLYAGYVYTRSRLDNS